MDELGLMPNFQNLNQNVKFWGCCLHIRGLFAACVSALSVLGQTGSQRRRCSLSWEHCLHPGSPYIRWRVNVYHAGERNPVGYTGRVPKKWSFVYILKSVNPRPPHCTVCTLVKMSTCQHSLLRSEVSKWHCKQPLGCAHPLWLQIPDSGFVSTEVSMIWSS